MFPCFSWISFKEFCFISAQTGGFYLIVETKKIKTNQLNHNFAGHRLLVCLVQGIMLPSPPPFHGPP